MAGVFLSWFLLSVSTVVSGLWLCKSPRMISPEDLPRRFSREDLLGFPEQFPDFLQLVSLFLPGVVHGDDQGGGHGDKHDGCEHSDDGCGVSAYEVEGVGYWGADSSEE